MIMTLRLLLQLLKNFLQKELVYFLNIFTESTVERFSLCNYSLGAAPAVAVMKLSFTNLVKARFDVIACSLAHKVSSRNTYFAVSPFMKPHKVSFNDAGSIPSNTPSPYKDTSFFPLLDPMKQEVWIQGRLFDLLLKQKLFNGLCFILWRFFLLLNFL